MSLAKFQELMVFGIKVKDTDFSFYTNVNDLSQWGFEFWKVAEQTLDAADFSGVKTISAALGADFERVRMARYDELFMQEQLTRPVNVNGVEHQALFIFDVLWESWDCDATGWVVKTDTGNKVVFTNHGSTYFVTADELNECVRDYQAMIEAGSGDFSETDYQDGIRDIQRALSMTN